MSIPDAAPTDIESRLKPLLRKAAFSYLGTRDLMIALRIDPGTMVRSSTKL
jgi:hypothetical protein